MADEQVADSTQATQETVFTPQDMEGVDKINAAGKPDMEMAPLFEDEGAFSEEELKTDGENPEDQQADKKAIGGTEDGKETSDSKKEDAATDQPKDEEADTEETADKDEDKKESFKKTVPYDALHAERMKRQELASENQSLKAELVRIKAGIPEGKDAQTGPPEDFKVLSDDEFAELAEDDPASAVIYQRDLAKHIERKAARDMQEQNEKSAIDRGFESMTRIVPDLFDESSESNQKLTDFAVNAGLDDINVIGLITNPGSKFLDANGNTQVLGEGAAKVLALLNSAYKAANAKTPESLRKEIEAEVTANLMKKFKTPGSAEHTSISNVPGSSGEELDMRDITEGNYGKLSAEEQRRWLGG